MNMQPARFKFPNSASRVAMFRSEWKITRDSVGAVIEIRTRIDLEDGDTWERFQIMGVSGHGDTEMFWIERAPE